MYYFMIKVADGESASASDSATPSHAQACDKEWSREVTTGAQTRYDEDDGIFCYDLKLDLYDECFRWYTINRHEVAKHIGPQLQWKSLQNLSRAMHHILTLDWSRNPRQDQHFEDAARAAEMLIAALEELMPLALRFSLVFDRVCLCVKSAMSHLAAAQIDGLLLSFASILVANAPQVIPAHAYSCDDPFLVASLSKALLDVLPFRERDAAKIRDVFVRVLPHGGQWGRARGDRR